MREKSKLPKTNVIVFADRAGHTADSIKAIKALHLNLRMAFDFVPYDILINKLRKYSLNR